MPRFEDLTGKTFGKLYVESIHGRDKYGKILYNCVCECGNKTVTLGRALKNGHTKSCGCLLNEIREDNAKYNGLHKTRIYSIWRGMVARCQNPNNKAFLDYGARGIKVCQEWKGTRGFYNFLAWSMDNGYEKHLSIDRINTNGNYEPSNCRWADWIIQANNRRMPAKVKNQYGEWDYRQPLPEPYKAVEE